MQQFWIIICCIGVLNAIPQGYKYPDASLVIHALTTTHQHNSNHPQTVRISSGPSPSAPSSVSSSSSHHSNNGFKYSTPQTHVSAASPSPSPLHYSSAVTPDYQQYGRTSQPIRVTPQPQNSYAHHHNHHQHQQTAAYKHPNPHAHVHHVQNTYSQSTIRPQTTANLAQLAGYQTNHSPAHSEINSAAQNLVISSGLSHSLDETVNIPPPLSSRQQGGAGYAYGKPVIVPQITKNIYIHTAPEEEDDETHEINIGPAHKQYKVIFIRAPVNKIPKLSIAPQQHDERTLIYVLSKKTDASDLQIQQAQLPKETTKPEVYFIKYKTPEEALNAQQQIQAHYDTLGGTTQVSDEVIAPIQSVIGSYSNPSISTSNSDTSEIISIPNNRYLPVAAN